MAKVPPSYQVDGVDLLWLAACDKGVAPTAKLSGKAASNAEPPTKVPKLGDWT